METRSKASSTPGARGHAAKKRSERKTSGKTTVRQGHALRALGGESIASENPFLVLSDHGGSPPPSGRENGDSDADGDARMSSQSPQERHATPNALVDLTDSASQQGEDTPRPRRMGDTPSDQPGMILDQIRDTIHDIYQLTGLIDPNPRNTRGTVQGLPLQGDPNEMDLDEDKENVQPATVQGGTQSLTIRGPPRAGTAVRMALSTQQTRTLQACGASTGPTFAAYANDPLYVTFRPPPHQPGPTAAPSQSTTDARQRSRTPRAHQGSHAGGALHNDKRAQRLPVGAPLLASKPLIPAKRAHDVDRSPNGKQVARDSAVSHKRPRLHGAGPISIASSTSPVAQPEFVQGSSTRTSQAHALHALAEAAYARNTASPEPHYAATAVKCESPDTTSYLRAGSGHAWTLNASGPGRADTPIPGSPSNPHLPGVVPASLEDYVTSGSATFGSADEPITNITPTPPSGFPDTYGGSPGRQLANQTKSSLAGWISIEGGKVLAVPFGQGANDHKVADRLFSTVAHIQQATARFLGITSVHVAPPIAEVPVADLNQAPFAFLIHGISNGRATQLITQRCISTPNVTVIFYPFGILLPSLFVSFGHIVDCGCDMVRNMALATLTRGPNLAAIIELLRETPGLPPTMDFQELARRLINTVRITRSERLGKGAVLTPVYNLFMSTSLMNADTWPRWRRLLNSFQWSDIFLAEVAVRSDVECEGCHGRDHYQHSCPFMSVPGFHGTLPPSRKRVPSNGTSQPRSQKAGSMDNGAPGPSGRVRTGKPPRSFARAAPAAR
ncbi:hypothetical protein PsYK624_105520 [Phanerochaete sordida]|uniref:Uncharacterized protein n=1 Tax=Phanerochaete sordida TaxID=48140 RepID=A0A9P3GE34_9APHY|nr:hypothetical protein PsYK624_105520 [Phanerochaete sordida]